MIRMEKLFSVFVLAFVMWTTTTPAIAQSKEDKTVEFISPVKNQVVQGRVTVEFKFTEAVNLSTFSAKLNKGDVTKLFSLTASGGAAELTINDGLNVNPDKPNGPFARNELDIEIEVIKGADKKAKQRKAKAKFFFNPNGGTDPTRVVKIIPPTGGQISLPNFGTIIFPPGAFITNQSVELVVTSDPETAPLYAVSSSIYGVGPSAAYELRVNTGTVPPATPFDVKLNVPSDLISQIPADQKPGVYAQIFDANDSEVLDYFELFSSDFIPVESSVSTTLPAIAATNQRTANGSYEAILLVGSAPIRQIVDNTPITDQLVLSANASSIMNARCATRPDIHKVLAPPLDGRLQFSDLFGAREGRHRGLDYRTRDSNDIPTEGREVRAIESGTIAQIGSHTLPELVKCNVTKIDRVVDVGFGQFVVIRHADNSKSLYAHLKPGSVIKPEGAKIAKDEIIALSGSSGTYSAITCGPAPHLHLEFIPSGENPAVKAGLLYKVDVKPCVSRDLYIANPNAFSRSNPGFITKLDATQEYLATGIPSGLTETGTRQTAAFNRVVYVDGAALATRDGIVFFAATGAANGIAATRNGVYVLDDILELGGGAGSDALVYRANHDGAAPAPLITLLGNFGDKTLAASDQRIVIIDFTKAFIYQADGSGGTGVSPNLTFFAGAATQDRIFLADHQLATPRNNGIIRVLNSSGVDVAAPIGPFLGRIFGVAASEKELYVSTSDQDQIYVFDRKVKRDNSGNIVTEDYIFKTTIAAPGFPMGLAVE